MGYAEFTAEIWKRLCKYTAQLRLVFGLSVFLIILLLVSLSMTEPGTATYVIIMVDLVSLGALALITGIVIRTCKKKGSRG